MIVLDASALVDVGLSRPNRSDLLAHMSEEISAPGHQLAEVLSAVARLLRTGQASEQEGMDAVAAALTIIQRTVALDDGLIQRALSLRESIRVTDGLYVALAERLGCPLLTSDGRLARSNPPCDVIFPGSAS
ncbi:MAG TPA: PIN domain-containing protein [Jatrophihabitans sp.]